MSLSSPNEFSGTQSLYDILDVAPDAGPQEIRAAYLRVKSSFQRDSLALYSLMGEAEAAQMLRQIEEAFLVLSNPDRRRVYDQGYRTFHSEDDASGSSASVISIDRVPPMSASEGSDDLLIPPTTDFAASPAVPSTQSAPPAAATAPFPASAPVHAKSAPTPVSPVTSGPELKEIRERQGVSMEYLVEITRVRKTYLQAIEAENFAALPAGVFIRGFLTQLARELHIPAEPLVTSFLKRYDAWKSAQKG